MSVSPPMAQSMPISGSAMSAVPYSTQPTTGSAFTFPGAASILSAAPPSHMTNGDESDDDATDDGKADGAQIVQLMIKFNCDAVRRKIQLFLATKTMTQAAFLAKIGVKIAAYRHFMSCRGKRQGSGSGMYTGALLFFHKLEKEEAAANAAAKLAAKSAAKGVKDTSGPKKLTRKEQAEKAQAMFDKISAVKLEEPVYVYDDCDEVRKKLNELIASGVTTQTAMQRELDVNLNSMRRFLSTTGKHEGASNGVYYSAYCFFEKLRISENKPKTKKRLNTEAEKPTGYSFNRDPTYVRFVFGQARVCHRT